MAVAMPAYSSLTMSVLDDLVWELDVLVKAGHSLRRRAFKIQFCFFKRKALMALSDDIAGVTSSLANVAAQFPPAISSALSSSFAAGAATGVTDTALSGAVSDLVSQASTTIGALQSALSTPAT